MGHVSHSQFVSYSECNLKWKLRYIDKLGTFTGNIHTLFGTAMHTTLQTYLTEMYGKSIVAAESLDLNGMLKTEMMKEFKIIKENQETLPCTQEEIVEFYQDGVAIMEEFFDAYNERRIEDVSALEHDDIELYAPNGMIVKGSEEHSKLSKMFLEANSNARWDILWSISNDIDFENKPNENWVTTAVNVSFGEGESESHLQRILDAQIVDGKIKKVYGYERVMAKEELNQ